MISANGTKYKINVKLLLPVLFIFLLLAIFQRWETESANNYISSGNSKLASGDYNGALSSYYYADKLDDRKSISYLAKVRRGEVFLKFGKYSEAERELAEAVKEEKRRHKAYELLGDLYYKKREFNRAINYYNDAIQYNDGTDTVLNVGIKRAKSFICKGETELAENILKGLRSQMPEGGSDKELLYYLGLLEFDKSMSFNGYLDGLRSYDAYKWKVEGIEKFIEKYDGKHNSSYNNVLAASLYDFLQEPYLAIDHGKKAIAINDSYRDAWIVLGKSHYIIEDYASSADDFMKALGLDGHNGETYFWLASVSVKMGNKELASEYFEKYEIFK